MTESNHNFDQSLKARNEQWGIRSLEDVKVKANEHGWDVLETIDMPVNNLCVVFQRRM